jgi:hypothetical protein
LVSIAPKQHFLTVNVTVINFTMNDSASPSDVSGEALNSRSFAIYRPKTKQFQILIWAGNNRVGLN